MELYMKKTLIMAGIISGLIISSAAQARDTLSLAGSSTVLPFARIIAEQLGKNPNFKTPVEQRRRAFRPGTRGRGEYLDTLLKKQPFLGKERFECA